MIKLKRPTGSLHKGEVRKSRAVFITLVIVSFAMLFPILWLVTIALKTSSELSSFPITWLPAVPQWQNFADAVNPDVTIPFLQQTKNSLILSTIAATLTTLTSAFVGFGFARLQGIGKKFFFTVLLALMMMPPIVTLIPTYLLFARVNLVNTYWPWVLWGLSGSAYAIFMFRQFFASLPKALEEAAILDGCSWFGVFWRIFLPLSKPALVTVFIMTFVWTWGDYITPSLLLDPENTTLAVGVAKGYQISQGYTINNLMSAGAVLYTLPVLLLFAMVQRAYVQGIANTGVKD